jgi:hypothetical protein
MYTSDLTHGWWRERITYRNQRWVTDDAPPPSSEPEPDVNDISDQPEDISSDQTVNIDYTNDDDMIQSVDCNTDNDVYQADNDGPLTVVPESEFQDSRSSLNWEKKVNNKRTFILISPQPAESDVVTLHKYYTTLKRQPDFKKRVT